MASSQVVVWFMKVKAYLIHVLDLVEKALVSKQGGEEVVSLSKEEKAKRNAPDFWRFRYEGEKMEKKKRYDPCCYCKREGHLKKFCWFRPYVKCWLCGKYGHVEKVCKMRKKEAKPRAQAHVAMENKPREEVSFAANCFTKCKSKGMWILDSGSSNHMCFEETLFCKLDKNKSENVRLANGTHIVACGRGDVLVNTPLGKKQICDVLFVPSLSVNLLSVGQMVERNYSLNFYDESCKIFDQKGCEVFEVSMRDKIFVLEFVDDDLGALTGSDEKEQSHGELGHIVNNFCGQEDATKVTKTRETSKSQERRVKKPKETKIEWTWTAREHEKALDKLSFVGDCKGSGGAEKEKEKTSVAAYSANNPNFNLCVHVNEDEKLHRDVEVNKAPEVTEISFDCVKGFEIPIIDDNVRKKRHVTSTSNVNCVWKVAGQKPTPKCDVFGKQKLHSGKC